jgi:hypothetical protein
VESGAERAGTYKMRREEGTQHKIRQQQREKIKILIQPTNQPTNFSSSEGKNSLEGTHQRHYAGFKAYMIQRQGRKRVGF